MQLCPRGNTLPHIVAWGRCCHEPLHVTYVVSTPAAMTRLPSAQVWNGFASSTLVPQPAAGKSASAARSRARTPPIEMRNAMAAVFVVVLFMIASSPRFDAYHGRAHAQKTIRPGAKARRRGNLARVDVGTTPARLLPRTSRRPLLLCLTFSPAR
jgi:hypothetical protein